ncbi:MAG: Rab family GTPase [Candidatus Thorarchaeota archaeon]|jgi:small GTP-binding protein
MTTQDKRHKSFKTVLIGDGAVGKTSLRRNYLGQTFEASHLATIGVDFAHKWITINGEATRIIIWDLAGQPTFARVRRHYYLGSHGIFLVYSVINRDSFDNASKWLVEAFKYIGRLPPTLVIGNKIDLRDDLPLGTYLTTEDGQKFTEYFSKTLDVPASYIETSALTGENVHSAFEQLIGMMTEKEKARL